jgi:alkyl hydroperoxide reductase subunit D
MNSAASQSMMDRVNELFQGSVVPYPFMEFQKVPAFLADFHMNFRRFVWDDGYLDPKTKSLIALAVIVHLQSKAWASWFENVRLPALGVAPEAGNDVRALVATCSMHNAYFKGLDFSGITLVGKTHGLRSHTPFHTCLDTTTAELISVVISMLNGCHRCTNGHVTSALGAGVTDPMIQEAFQCAATMVAGVSFLNAL